MMRRRRALLVVTVTGVFLELLAALVVNSASDQAPWPGPLEFVRLHPWLPLIVLLIFIVVLAILAWALTGPDPPPVDLAIIADNLAIAVKSQWDAEATLRQLNDPYPMQVRWGPADANLVADWSVLNTLAKTGAGWPDAAPERWAAGPEALAGADNDLVNALERIPTGRLVVLGERGAGKTILLVRLELDLLARRPSGGTVPVLLPLASWDPVEEDLLSWMERRLITNHVALADPTPNRPNVTRARALLDAGLILPILDGLDEIPDGVRGPAITRINDAMRPGGRLVLAARTKAYRTAVHRPGGVGIQLTGAAGICLSPLEADVVAKYLKDSAGGPEGAARWDPVIAMFTAGYRSPVVQALTTPLMATLARANYNPRPKESVDAIPNQPVELLDRARFPDPESIRLYLFDRFIPAAYREHPDPSRRNKWSATQAQRWLAYLARDLEHRQNGTTDFAWWELRGAVPRLLPALTVGLVAGLAGALGFSFPMEKGVGIGLGIGLAAACLVGLLVRRLIHVGVERPTRGLAGGLLGGMFGALASFAAFGSGLWGKNVGVFATGLALGVAVIPLGKVVTAFVGAFTGILISAASTYTALSHLFGGVRGPAMVFTNAFGFGLAVGMAVSLADRRRPSRGRRWSPLGSVFGLIAGLVLGAVTWIKVGSDGGLLVVFVCMIAGGFAGGFAFEVAEADLTRATSSKAVLTRDRSAFRSVALSLGIGIGLGTGLALGLSPSASDGLPNGWRLGVGIGIANLIGVGLAAGFLQASWGSYTLARWWLAGSRHLPWRLMTFLADAHNRGVLRQAGAVYQFRHAELQRRLARSPNRM